MIDKVFICTSKEQAIPAKISKYSFETQLSSNVEVEIIHNESIPHLDRLHYKQYMRNGILEIFNPEDMQSFTLARFFIPEIMNFKGNVLVIDPDIFLTNAEHFLKYQNFNYEQFSIFCRRSLSKSSWASSAMFLNCNKLTHWRIETFISELLKKEIDYNDLIGLKLESPNIFEISNSWNDFDNLNDKTILLHLTQKDTQPWRVGLKLNSYIPPILGVIPRTLIYRLLGRNLNIGREHPNKEISNLFFKIFQDCLRREIITEDELDSAVNNGYLRNDIKKIVSFDFV